MHACVRVCTATTRMAVIVVHMQKLDNDLESLRFCFASGIVSFEWTNQVIVKSFNFNHSLAIKMCIVNSLTS